MQNKIVITAKDIEGKTHILDNLLELISTKSLDTPADILKCSFSSNILVPEIHEIDLNFNDIKLFSGYVDNQSFMLSKNGSILSFCARSKASLLLDNEAMPMVFTGANIYDIYSKYIGHHKIFNLYYDKFAYRYQFSVTKGLSEWEVFTNFCKLSNNAVPHIDKDLTISLLPRYTSKTIAVSNTENGMRYLSLKMINDRYSVISSIGIRDDDGYYNSEVKNFEAGNYKITRRRYVIPPSSYTTLPVVDADQKIQISMGKKLNFEIVFAGFENLNIGDFLNIYEPLFSHRGRLVISEVKHSVSKNGSFTVIKATTLKYF